jgi:hypothetical protein
MATNAKPKTKTTTSKTEEPTQVRASAYVRQTAERAVDVPVGAALTVRDRVNDAVQPWTSTEARTKELKDLRTQVTRELNKLERRGGQARRKATQSVRQTRNRVERGLTQRRRSVERTVKARRTRVEQRLRKVETTVKENRTKVQERVSSLV